MVFCALAVIGCESVDGERETYTDIDDLIEDAAWDTVDILMEVAESESNPKSRILVVSYFTEEGEKSDMSEYLIQSLTSEIANAIRIEGIDIKIVSRSNLDKAMDELAFQMSDLADQEKQLTIGKQLGADVILAGTLTWFEDVYKLNTQLSEIETGVVLGGSVLNLEHDESE